MDVIVFSKSEFEKLRPLKISYEVYNTESDILTFNFKGKQKIIKTFFDLDYDLLENKIYTITMLDKYRRILPKEFCIPEALVSVNDNLKGFVLPRKIGKNLTSIFMDENIAWEKKRLCFIKIGELLDKLKKVRENTELKDIFIGDLHDSNLLLTKNKHLVVLDLDSCKIAGNKSPVSRYLTPYSLLRRASKCKYDLIEDKSERAAARVDENTDLYCFYMMLLSQLYGDSADCLDEKDFNRYLDYLDKIGIDIRLMDAFDALLSLKDNINPYEAIETITEEQARLADAVEYGKYLKKTR